MMKRQRLALALAVLALSNYAAAAGFNLGHFHHKKEAEVAVSGPRDVAVSGPRDVAVSGARSIETYRTKHDALKEALGLGGSVVASSVPSGCQSAYSIVQSNEGFTFLNNAIVASGLVSVLDDPALVATVFAPNDEAFTASLIDLGVSPQELFNDVITLTIVLKYHVIPGLSLEKEDFKDGQPYYTLLTDKHKNKYTIEFDYEKEIDLKSLKLDGSLEDATSSTYSIGGAEIIAFDINAGCPTVVHVIDSVLIPDYKDALLAEAGDTAIGILATYDEAGAPRPTLPGLAPSP